MSRAPMPDTVKGDAPMPSSFDEDLEFWEEGRWAKIWRKLKEEPLIPVGLAMTCYALWGATKSIRRGDKTQTNRFFRARVYAQGFTLLCICVGSIYWKEDREKRKYYQGLLGEKRAQEKRDAWIRELEARDKEDQVEREAKAKRRQERKQMREEAEKNERPVDAASALSVDEMRDLAGRSSLLAPAMWLWRWRASESEE